MIIINYIDKQGKEKTDFLDCVNKDDIDHVLMAFDKGEKINIEVLDFKK